MSLRQRKMTGLWGHHPLFLKAWFSTFQGISSLFLSMPQSTGCGQSSTGGTSGLPFLGTSLSLAVVWDNSWHPDETLLPLQAGTCFSTNTAQISINCCLELLFSPDQWKLGSSSNVSLQPCPASVRLCLSSETLGFSPETPKSPFCSGQPCNRLKAYFDNSMFRSRRGFSRDAVWGKWLCFFEADCQISQLSWC